MDPENTWISILHDESSCSDVKQNGYGDCVISKITWIQCTLMMVVNLLDLKEMLKIDSLENLEICPLKSYNETPPQLKSIWD